MEIMQITENIHRITLPYKEIFTTVYTVKTEQGVLLFDAASFDEDVEEYILPFLEKFEITQDELKYIFISHNHKDHAGGLCQLLKFYPDVCVVSGSDELKEQYSNYNVVSYYDNDCFLNLYGTLDFKYVGGDAQRTTFLRKYSDTEMPWCGYCLLLILHTILTYQAHRPRGSISSCL